MELASTSASAGLPAARGLQQAALAVACGLVLALQFGPLVGLLGFRLSGNEAWAWNGLARDGAVVVLLLLAALAWLGAGSVRRLPASVQWALVMVGVDALLALLTSGSPLLMALNVRRLVLVPLLFVAVWCMPWAPRQIDRLFAWVLASGVAVALFGVFEYLAPEPLWSEVLDIQAYTAANNFDRFGQQDYHEAGRFFSSDLEAWTGGPLRRLISTYLEPTTLAAGMATLLCMGLARRARGHRAWLPVVLALFCGVATLSKGFVAFLILLLAWRVLGMPSPRHLLLLVLVSCAAALAAAELHLEGPLAHVDGLITALHYLAQGHWLGEGIGAAGNYSDMGAEIGEESGLGNVIGQVGIAAVFSLLWLRALARDVLAAAAARRDPGGPWIAAWLLFWTVTYVFSASSLGVGGNALGFMVLALYLHPASGATGR